MSLPLSLHLSHLNETKWVSNLVVRCGVHLMLITEQTCVQHIRYFKVSILKTKRKAMIVAFICQELVQ